MSLRRIVSLRTAAAAVPFLLFLVVYAPRAGRGFVADDFEWALRNRTRSVTDAISIISRDNGFYRPVVAASFAANEYVARTNPKPYGLTNVLLAAACAAAVFALCAALRLPRGAALLAAAIWLLNFHGINMAVLWISGRTALLLTLGATLSIASLVRGRTVLALAWFALALFSKEEAILLPLIGAAWLYLVGSRKQRQAVMWLVGCTAIVAAYLLLRSNTEAMTPFNAPPYYRFTFDIRDVAKNLVEYADRTLSFGVALTVLAMAILRAVPRPLASELLRVLAACTVWIALSVAITIFLPVRSSLYVCLPSVGAAVAAAAVIATTWERSTPTLQRYALYAAILVPLALFPIYAIRTHRYVRKAR